MPTKKSKKIKVPKGYKLIFRRYRKDSKSSKQLDARLYGIRAWPLLVPINSAESGVGG